MKRLTTGLCAVILLLGGFAAADTGLTTLPEFTSTTSPSSAISQRVWGKAVKLTGLTTGLCLTLDGSSFITTTACGGGGGGANSKWATSTGSTIIPNGGGGIIISASSTFSNLLNLTNASSSLSTFLGATWLTSLTHKLLSTDANGQIVATTSIGTNFLTGALGTINGSSLVVGGSITISAASSTLLSNNNTFSGVNSFTGNTTLANATSTNFFATTASSTNLFSASASFGALTFPSIKNAVLGTDQNGLVAATTTIGVNYLTGTLPVTKGGTGAATLTGCLTGNGTGPITGSGTCYTGSGANPTASIGLTAVNGVSTSFMRSDAAPALDQSIAAIWTAASTTHTGHVAINTASSTQFTSSTIWTGLGTAAGTLLAVDPNGKIIATSTPAVGGSGTVTNVTCGTGLTGGSFSTTGTCALDLTAQNIWTGASTTWTQHLSLNTASTTILTAPVLFTGLTPFKITTTDANGLLVASSTVGNTFLANNGALTVTAGAGLAGGGSVALGGSTSLTLDQAFAAIWTAASTTFVNHLSLNNASSTLHTIGTLWLPSLTNKLLSTDANGQVVATSSVGTNFLTGVLAAAQFPALTGDITTSAGSLATALKSTGSAGTYRSTTFDAQGRETSGTNPTTFSGYAISDSSANFFAAITDETGGGGNVVGSASPTFTGKAIFAAASTTDLSASGSLYGPFASAVWVSDGSKLATAATAQTCVNQFMRSMSATYVGGCAAVSLTADVTGTLPIGNGGTGSTNLGTGVVQASSGVLSAANPTRSFIIGVSSTTPLLAASTTAPQFSFGIGMTVTSWSCTVAPAGATAEISWQYANPTAYATVGPTYLAASSTPGSVAISSNNTPTAQATSTISVGSPTGNATSAFCTFVGNSATI